MSQDLLFIIPYWESYVIEFLKPHIQREIEKTCKDIGAVSGKEKLAKR